MCKKELATLKLFLIQYFFSCKCIFFKNNYSLKWFISTQTERRRLENQQQKKPNKTHKFWLQLKGIKNSQELHFYNSKLHFALHS